MRAGVLNEVWETRLKQMWRWQRSFRVRGAVKVTNTESTCNVDLYGDGGTAAAGGRDTVVATLTSRQVDAQYGYRYEWSEAWEKDDGAWESNGEAISGTFSENFARPMSPYAERFEPGAIVLLKWSPVLTPEDVGSGTPEEPETPETWTGAWVIDEPRIRRFFWAIIDGHKQDGSNKRWRYGFKEAQKDPGYGGWAEYTSSDKIAWTKDDSAAAYNRYEAINGASGLYGNGVDSGHLTGTFDIQPIPDGTPVLMEIVWQTSSPYAREYWFAAMNGIDGECPS